MESRKLVLWTSEGVSPEGEVGERTLGVGAVVSEDGESRSGEVWGREDELNVCGMRLEKFGEMAEPGPEMETRRTLWLGKYNPVHKQD